MFLNIAINVNQNYAKHDISMTQIQYYFSCRFVLEIIIESIKKPFVFVTIYSWMCIPNIKVLWNWMAHPNITILQII